MNIQNQEAKRKAIYAKLKAARAEMDADHRRFVRSRAAYHNALDEYIKIDRELAQNNIEELPAKEAPKKNGKKVKSKREQLQELAKEVGREDLLEIINGKG